MGINRNQIPFELRSELIPVALVDSSVDFLASPTPAYRVPDIATEGTQTAPAAAAILATTGPLPVGAYTLIAIVTAEEANRFRLNWRNALDTANLLNIVFALPAAGETITLSFRLNIENPNERFTIDNIAAGNVGITYNATFLVRI